MGFGTEMIEEEVRRAFPDLSICRVDTDSVTKRGSLETTLAAFRTGAIDILLGTQMVAKGLNFPGVRLVGVIFADTGLHLPDFRAGERTFSLLVQVAGRAGRFFPDGKVLVQTLRPQDEVIRRAAALDVDGFFDAELANRQMQDFPPYSRLIRVVARSRTAARAAAAAARLKLIIVALREEDAAASSCGGRSAGVRVGGASGGGRVGANTFTNEILGPADCPLSLIAGNYRRQLILRGKDMGVLHALVRRALARYEEGKDSLVYLEVDVDPVSLL
jgi:primosomal protein N' (replication factor Y)